MLEMPSWLPNWVVAIVFVQAAVVAIIIAIGQKTSWFKRNGRYGVLERENQSLKGNIQQRDEFNKTIQGLLDSTISTAQINLEKHDEGDKNVLELTKQLIESQELIRESLDIIPHGFALVNESDGLIICNASFAKPFTEAGPGNLQDITIADLIILGTATYQRIRSPTEDRSSEGFGEVWLSLLRGEIPYIELQRKSDKRWFMVTSTRSPRGNVSIFRVDITDQKNREVQEYDG